MLRALAFVPVRQKQIGTYGRRCWCPTWRSCVVGINLGASGVLLPSQMASYGVSRATIGITLFTVSAGFVLAGMSTGAMVARFGIRTTLTAGGAAFAVASLYLASRPPFAAFVLAQLVTGYGLGVLESVLNVYLAALPDATTLLNRLHAFFGVGALLGPPLAAWILGFASWTVVLLVVSAACVPLVVGFLVAYPGPRLPARRSQPQRATAAPPTRPRRNRRHLRPRLGGIPRRLPRRRRLLAHAGPGHPARRGDAGYLRRPGTQRG